ncbi:MAG: hypothetical protein DA405_10410 [Bacteroidetes bacterium]|nr:MAG: hypothetical protein DA405_10410 [Bacteroidota bacterium]
MSIKLSTTEIKSHKVLFTLWSYRDVVARGPLQFGAKLKELWQLRILGILKNSWGSWQLVA